MTNQGNGFSKEFLEDAPSIEALINHPGECVMLWLPKVQTQLGPYCVFYAIAYVVECQTRAAINVMAYVTDYIMKLRKSGNYKKINEEMTDLEVFRNEGGNGRVVTALRMLMNEGVMAEQNGLEVRVHISGYECHKPMNYGEVCDMLNRGVPILGSFSVGADFDMLKCNVYETILGSHMVMFVGHGNRNGRPYLVFQNSYGTKWGTNGLGRIYFNQVFQDEKYESFRFITLQVGEVGTHLSKVSPGLHVPTSELPHQLDDKPAPRFETTYPGQAYANGNIKIRLQESAARYNENGKSSKTHQSMEEMKSSLLAGMMEPWWIEQSITKFVSQAITEQGDYSHPYLQEFAARYNEFTKPSKAYQDSETSVIGKGFHGDVYTSSSIQDIIDINEVGTISESFLSKHVTKLEQLHFIRMPESKPDPEMICFSRVFTSCYSETVIHNMSELCVGKDVRADKLDNLDPTGHGESMEDDLKEIRDNQWKLFWVSDFGKERALMDQIDPAQ